ncbi:MAG: GGDEF domain-containing protein [Gammaproteobacteria bacterium]|nr:GGDEF domain-containing protein [Gammaproteobacteria bacterium]
MQTNTSTLELIKELRDVKGVFANYEHTSSRKTFDKNEQKQLILDLSIRLQMSLDIEWVISQFMEYVHAYILFDGYDYQLNGLNISNKLGRQSGHRCSYNLKIDDHDLGSLVVFRGRKFSGSELTLFENLLCSILYPLKNSIQFHSAVLSARYDVLTGVNNRSSFDVSLDREISLSKRNSQALSLLVIDIDHFKSVNDNYGHAAGDEVLKVVAGRIQASMRKSDLLFRYGGEEFVAILNNSDCDEAREVAERVLDTVRNNVVEYQGQALSVSVSIGLTCLIQADTRESVFDRADNALYEAKHSGRDQVKVA